MATFSYQDDVLPSILPELAGCSEALALQAAQECINDFCQRTHAYRATLSKTRTRANRFEYSLDLPADAALVQIHAVSLDGEPIDPSDEHTLARIWPRWREHPGTPRYYTQPVSDDTLIWLAPMPDAVQALLIEVSLTPAGDDATIPESLYRRYRSGINAGIKSVLMNKQGTLFYNPRQAAVYAQDFDDAVAEATGRASSNNTRAARRTRSYYK